MSQSTVASPPLAGPKLPADVLTSAEAAEYLRVAEHDVLELAARGDLPGRKVRNEWRFHLQSLVDWLRRPSPRERLMRHAGVAKDDPHMEKLVERIYCQRERDHGKDDG